MNAKLFRENGEVACSDIHFSHVGPGHERAYFGLVAIAGYAPAKNTYDRPYYAPPFHIYSMGGDRPDPEYKTIPAAKRAVRRWIVRWLASSRSIDWKTEATGVHFTARSGGITVGSYYFCPNGTKNYHKAMLGSAFYENSK